MVAQLVQVPCSWGNKLVVPGVTHLGKHLGKGTHLPFRSWSRALWQSRELGFERVKVTVNSQNALERPLGQAFGRKQHGKSSFPKLWALVHCYRKCLLLGLWLSQGHRMAEAGISAPWSGRITCSQFPRTMSRGFFNIRKM